MTLSRDEREEEKRMGSKIFLPPPFCFVLCSASFFFLWGDSYMTSVHTPHFEGGGGMQKEDEASKVA